MTLAQEQDPMAQLIQQEYEQNKLLAGDDMSEASSFDADRANIEHSQSYLLPGIEIGPLSPSRLTEDEMKIRRLSNKSRTSLDKKE